MDQTFACHKEQSMDDDNHSGGDGMPIDYLWQYYKYVLPMFTKSRLYMYIDLYKT